MRNHVVALISGVLMAFAMIYCKSYGALLTTHGLVVLERWGLIKPGETALLLVWISDVVWTVFVAGIGALGIGWLVSERPARYGVTAGLVCVCSLVLVAWYARVDVQPVDMIQYVIVVATSWWGSRKAYTTFRRSS